MLSTPRYSILDDECLEVKNTIGKWLSSSNFDNNKRDAVIVGRVDKKIGRIVIVAQIKQSCKLTGTVLHFNRKSTIRKYPWTLIT